MRDVAEWVSISEAERLTGLSVRTIKRMAAEGQLRCSRTPGSHMRVSREDVDRLLRREAPASVSASSVLATKRERVEELSLELQETRARREIRKLSDEDAEAERRRAQAQRAQELADERALEEARLQTAHEAERREREECEAEAQRRRAEFRRRWVSFATDRFPGWLSFEQRQTVFAAVEETICARDPEDNDLMPRLVSDAISRICAPWEAAHGAERKRQELIERAIRWELPPGATDADKAHAAAAVRSALSQVPLTASDSESRTAVSGAIEPIVRSIEERKAAERQNQKERADSQWRAVRKRTLVSAGVEHVSSYLSKLRDAGEITRDEYLDFDWRKELQSEVREALEAELTGADDESESDAKQIAEEIVDEELA